MYFLCVRLLNDSQYLPDTRSFGRVDIRPAKLDDKNERFAIQQSIELFKLNIDIETPNRMATIVEAKNVNEAYELSSAAFIEVIDLFELHSVYAKRDDLLKCGFIKRLDSLSIVSITPLLLGIHDFPGAAFLMGREKYSHIEPYQLIAQLGTLAALALKRSAHWARLAKTESNPYMQLLFYWIAFESLCTVVRNEDIIPKICLVLGFPLGNYSRVMRPQTIAELHKIEHYRTWRKCIEGDLKIIRKIRNDLVHDGFRTFEINPNLKEYKTILNIAFHRLIGYYKQAIYDDHKELKDVWDNMYLYVQANKDLISDLKGNLLYSLKNGMF